MEQRVGEWQGYTERSGNLKSRTRYALLTFVKHETTVLLRPKAETSLIAATWTQTFPHLSVS